MADINVMKKVLEKVDNGMEAAIVSITRSSGSTPRQVGTTFGVLGDGSIIGTIGGGALENRVMQLAKEAIEKGESIAHHLPLDSEGIKMVCGGDVDIFIDVFKKRPRLLISGGGHVGYELYRAASLLDFDIVVFDDREEFLNEERFPLAKEIILGPMNENLKKYKMTEDSYIVIVTRGHSLDQECLEAVIGADVKYIGAMGSKRKVIIMMDNLIELGFSKDDLSKIYAPIGLDIATNKPSEIAISILGEILQIKNEGELVNRKREVK